MNGNLFADKLPTLETISNLKGSFNRLVLQELETQPVT